MASETTGRRWARRLGVLGVLGAAVGVSVAQQPPTRVQPAPTQVAPTQPTQPQPVQPLPAQPAQLPPAARPADPAAPVAYIYESVPVTQEEFGKFLMDRGGAEKLELFVNKKIIEAEAARRKVTVTATEMKAALKDDLAGVDGILTEADFIKVVLPKYNRTLYEWMEDVIRPRLLLTKMCRDRIKIEEKDLRVIYDREYGERRRVQMILWPSKEDLKVIEKVYADIRDNPDEFDRQARQQANPSLAAKTGHVQPIGRNLVAEDHTVEDTAFKLKKGEVSGVMGTPTGWVVIKLVDVVPPNAAVTFESVKAKLEKAAFDERLAVEIPKFFAELKGVAKPQLFNVVPAEWKTVANATDGGSVLVPGSGGVVAPVAGKR